MELLEVLEAVGLLVHKLRDAPEGGTFVYMDTELEPLLVAGGGGGASYYTYSRAYCNLTTINSISYTFRWAQCSNWRMRRRRQSLVIRWLSWMRWTRIAFVYSLPEMTAVGRMVRAINIYL